VECIFCHDLKKRDLLFETNFFQAVYDIDPVQDGHLLVVSKRHVMNIQELTTVEELELLHIQKKVIQSIEGALKVDGVSIIINNGKIMDENTHFHIHFVPRYYVDTFWDHQVVKEVPIDKLKLTDRLKGAFHV
jgi:diadenosine tetraphosphate (Ap4A) HIT family hydrolase